MRSVENAELGVAVPVWNRPCIQRFFVRLVGHRTLLGCSASPTGQPASAAATGGLRQADHVGDVVAQIVRAEQVGDADGVVDGTTVALMGDTGSRFIVDPSGRTTY
jgi:hypothetical protein